MRFNEPWRWRQHAGHLRVAWDMAPEEGGFAVRSWIAATSTAIAPTTIKDTLKRYDESGRPYRLHPTTPGGLGLAMN